MCIRDRAELEKLRKIFTVKSKSATIYRPYALALSSHRTRKRKRSLGSLCRILRECRHHHARNTLRNLVGPLTQIERLLLTVRAHNNRSMAREWRLAGQHLIGAHTE